MLTGTGRSKRGAKRVGTRMRSALLLGLLLACGSGGCRSGPEAARFEVAPWAWGGRAGQRLTSEHFVVYTTVEDAALARSFPVLLERAYREHRLRMPALRPNELRMETFVFGSRREWEAYTRTEYPQSFAVYRLIRAGGFTEGGRAVLFHTTPAVTLATVAHESWHQYVETCAGGTLPAWLNEGLACYHESFDFTHTPPRPIPLNNSFRLEHLRQSLTTGSRFTLRELLETEPGEVLSRDDASVTQTYYAGVWALTAFLCHGQGGRFAKAFDRMMSDAASGTLGIRVRASVLTEGAATGSSFGHAVFVLYFGGVDEAMEEAFAEYIAGLAGVAADVERWPTTTDPRTEPQRVPEDGGDRI
ncbi:MAG: DUF1570 domain-containing protein [Planctomycetota bacterium]|nr:MAG: DUF1570 domain-containing protein [Planctomycetota bacterium]KAB2939399.1 MAG: DUF1570 domain-containing protein [Phycisphaerae bacterium]MCQ3922374.1 hypothetical protein [Planctomycetota bacterium]